jgi:hypothetical protein
MRQESVWEGILFLVGFSGVNSLYQLCDFPGQSRISWCFVLNFVSLQRNANCIRVADMDESTLSPSIWLLELQANRQKQGMKKRISCHSGKTQATEMAYDLCR